MELPRQCLMEEPGKHHSDDKWLCVTQYTLFNRCVKSRCLWFHINLGMTLDVVRIHSSGCCVTPLDWATGKGPIWGGWGSALLEPYKWPYNNSSVPQWEVFVLRNPSFKACFISPFCSVFLWRSHGERRPPSSPSSSLSSISHHTVLCSTAVHSVTLVKGWVSNCSPSSLVKRRSWFCFPVDFSV